MWTIREWTLEGEAGRGGMGVVYRARHRFQEGLFAVKVIRPDLVADAKVRAYFLREVTQAGKLEHEGIVKMHLPFEEHGQLFLPMEHLDGLTLQNLIEREGPQPEARAIRLVRQAAEALGYAHTRTPTVIHRDIKPANLFVLTGDRVKLIDFGVARALGGDSLQSSVGRLPGTPLYLAPEVLEGHEAGAASDVFALGVVLFQLLTGTLPAQVPAGGSLWSVLAALQKAHERGLPSPKAVVPGLSDLADTVTARLMARSLAERPPDGAMAARLLAGAEAQLSFVRPLSMSLRPIEPGAETALGVRGLGAAKPSLGRHGGGAGPWPESSLGVRGLDETARPLARSAELAGQQSHGMVEAQVSQPLPHLNTGAVRTARSDPASPEVAVSDADRERDPHLPVWILASLVLFALFIAAIVWGTDRATSAAKTTHRPPGEGDIQETLRYINADGSLAEFNEETMKLVEKDPSKALSKLLGRDSLDSGGVDKPGSQAERANRTSSAEMVSVPAGEFSFGCNKAVDRECKDNEQPLRRFTLPTFLIDRTEVTVAAYRACVQAGKCSAPRMGGSCNWNSGRDDHPINCVTWGQARAYCQWQGKRLPTEYEWEKAARGAEGRLYAWGSEAVSSGRYANIAGTADGWKATAPVGTYPAGRSPYGADDMIGNVWEWCASVDDPRPGEPLRGGSWADEPRYVRASYRGRDEQGAKGEDYGFRCVR